MFPLTIALKTPASVNEVCVYFVPLGLQYMQERHPKPQSFLIFNWRSPNIEVFPKAFAYDLSSPANRHPDTVVNIIVKWLDQACTVLGYMLDLGVYADTSLVQGNFVSHTKI